MKLTPLVVAALLPSVPAIAVAQAPAPTDAAPAATAPAAPSAPGAKPPKRLWFGGWGALPFGEHLSTAITPIEASYQVNAPDTSWAFGIVGEYDLAPSVRLFLDGGLYRQSVVVAKPGSYGESFWVYEQTGYTSHQIGPFPKGVTYFMDTTAIRLGASWVAPVGSFEAWVGGTVGLYAWQATYGTPDRKEKYGQTSGTVAGVTLMAGADWPIDDTFKLGLFADVMSPAAEGDMHDLFNPGWTWHVAHHVMGPYRIGVRVLF